MPTISKKGIAMPESPIRKLVPYSDKAKKSGKNVFHLNIGQPDIASPQSALEAVKGMNRTVIEYSQSAGFQSYRAGLAKYYRSKNIQVTMEEIIVTTGGSEALIFAFLSCFDPGDEVIIPEPFYANYNGFAKMAGINIIPVTSSIDNGFALPSIDEFKKSVTPKTKGIVICNPGNPTGYLYGQEELEVLRDVVADNDLFLFADEVYREFVYDGLEPISIMNLDGISQNVVLIDSVSKRYSMCGARIGAIVSYNKELMATVLKFAQARLSPPTLAQIASEGALETPQSYFDSVVEEYVERRDILVDGLNTIEGVYCPKPSGAFYCMAKLPVESSEDFCQWLLEEFDLNGNTVMMAPASGFYATEGLGINEVRIAYVLNADDLKKAVECIRVALNIYSGTTR